MIIQFHKINQVNFNVNLLIITTFYNVYLINKNHKVNVHTIAHKILIFAGLYLVLHLKYTQVLNSLVLV
jgi:hypothetical protein